MLGASFGVYIPISFALRAIIRKGIVFFIVNLIVFIRVDAAEKFAIIIIFCCRPFDGY